ncbi:hypothetical protein ADUPG1_006711 [Aduncisulcus paluster]|uniref:Uncharacterized protein n=1 Tax=Aduncisulcus paluster TaxID=2918883 RepID=A0ABQ5KMQ5_9EUKA|nr:hypothetical protein ADUPG1_006711 [Aduncisulcus paluster]
MNIRVQFATPNRIRCYAFLVGGDVTKQTPSRELPQFSDKGVLMFYYDAINQACLRIVANPHGGAYQPAIYDVGHPTRVFFLEMGKLVVYPKSNPNPLMFHFASSKEFDVRVKNFFGPIFIKPKKRPVPTPGPIIGPTPKRDDPTPVDPTRPTPKQRKKNPFPQFRYDSPDQIPLTKLHLYATLQEPDSSDSGKTGSAEKRLSDLATTKVPPEIEVTPASSLLKQMMICPLKKAGMSNEDVYTNTIKSMGAESLKSVSAVESRAKSDPLAKKYGIIMEALKTDFEGPQFKKPEEKKRARDSVSNLMDSGVSAQVAVSALRSTFWNVRRAHQVIQAQRRSGATMGYGSGGYSTGGYGVGGYGAGGFTGF